MQTAVVPGAAGVTRRWPEGGLEGPGRWEWGGITRHPALSTLAIPPLVRQMPCRHIAVAVTRSPEVGIGPVDLRLGGAGGVEGGAGVAVQEHVGVGRLR